MQKQELVNKFHVLVLFGCNTITNKGLFFGGWSNSHGSFYLCDLKIHTNCNLLWGSKFKIFDAALK